jgi:excisionase family DNA binding protein
MLTPEEVQEFLGLGKTTVYELIRKGELSHRRPGRRIFVPKEGFLPRDSKSLASPWEKK